MTCLETRTEAIEKLLDEYLTGNPKYLANGYFHQEFGEELPSPLCAILTDLGAIVSVYRHHGTTATVVTY